jgi:hypothetical protein
MNIFEEMTKKRKPHRKGLATSSVNRVIIHAGRFLGEAIKPASPASQPFKLNHSRRAIDARVIPIGREEIFSLKADLIPNRNIQLITP